MYLNYGFIVLFSLNVTIENLAASRLKDYLSEKKIYSL